MVRIVSSLLLVVLATACGLEEQKAYSKLEGLRILALIADAPEINSPGTVNITPFLSYVDGGDTLLDFSYQACLDPGISFGAETSCDSAADLLLEGSGTFATSSIGASNFYTGAMSPISVNIGPEAFALLASIESTVAFNGVDMIVIISVADQNERSQNIKTFKRISLTTKTTNLNTNPTISGEIEVEGSAINTFPDNTAELSLSGLSAAETYETKSTSGTTTITETMTISWFSSAGSLSNSRTSPTGYPSFVPQDDTEGVFVTVYRDDRGGVAVKPTWCLSGAQCVR